MFRKIINSLSSFFLKHRHRLVQEPPQVANKNQFTIGLIVAIVALRLLVGWHFFTEGSTKLSDGKFSSAGFLRGAKGPFAGMYKGLLKDDEGLLRLNFDPEQKGANRVNPSKTLGVWDIFRQDVAAYYRFDKKQLGSADRVFRRREEQLKIFFAENSEDINEYFLGLERRDSNIRDPARRGVATLADQSQEIASKLRGKPSAWLAQIEEMWAAYENDINKVANDEQRKRRGNRPLELKRPGESWYTIVESAGGGGKMRVRSAIKFFDVDFVDWFIPRLDLFIGVLLILGLFTRFASVLGAMFLSSVIVSQWPWSMGALPSHYQAIEMLTLVALVITGAGRFAGLDYFIANWRHSSQELKTLAARIKQKIEEKKSQEAKNEPNA